MVWSQEGYIIPEIKFKPLLAHLRSLHMPPKPSELKERGLKVTHPRMKILELFQQSDVRHMTAEDVYQHLLAQNIEIGLATVYRVLTQFEQAGLLERHNFESGKAIFEINEGHHHDHLVCLDCGRVEEFYDPEIERRQEAIAAERGFEIEEHALYIYGHCAKAHCEHRNQCSPKTDQEDQDLAKPQ